MSRLRSAEGRAHWPRPPLSWLPSALTEPRSILASVAVGWLMAFPVSIAIAVLLQLLMPQAEGPAFQVAGGVAIFALVVFAPIAETLIMAAILALLLRLTTPTLAVLASSALWGVAHSLAAPTWGLVIWWPFLIFSALYVTWRERSLLLALVVPMTVHALQNLGPALALAGGVKA